MSASRFSLIRVLFLALVLALVASARASEDDHDDHDDHGEEELVDWACTANCPTDTGAAHPCGAGELVESDDYSTCNLTKTNIMDVAGYATATHVVPCPSDVCEAQCNSTADGASNGVFNCFNTSVTMDSTALAANHRGLAVGCPGNHSMTATGNFMRGDTHGACEAGSVHFHDDDHDDESAAARATFAAAALALALALAAA